MKIEHHAGQSRFTAGDAFLAYREHDGALDLTHTVVPPDQRDQGVGSALVEHAVRYAKEHDYRVIPSCPFARAWLDEHPEYEDVVRR